MIKLGSNKWSLFSNNVLKEYMPLQLLLELDDYKLSSLKAKFLLFKFNVLSNILSHSVRLSFLITIAMGGVWALFDKATLEWFLVSNGILLTIVFAIKTWINEGTLKNIVSLLLNEYIEDHKNKLNEEDKKTIAVLYQTKYDYPSNKNALGALKFLVGRFLLSKVRDDFDLVWLRGLVKEHFQKENVKKLLKEAGVTFVKNSDTYGTNCFLVIPKSSVLTEDEWEKFLHKGSVVWSETETQKDLDCLLQKSLNLLREINLKNQLKEDDINHSRVKSAIKIKKV